MKNLKRTISVILCVVLIAVTFCGCTVNLNIKIDRTGSSPAAADSTPATQAPATQAPATTAAPAGDATTAAPSGDATTAAPSGDATAATPSGDPKTTEEILKVYAEVYNTTKAAGTFTGKNSMECTSIVLDGKENGMLKNLAGTVLKSNDTGISLPPNKDGDSRGATCQVKVEDIKEGGATYTDNGDGTATIKLVPIDTTNSKRFEDAQGRMFNVMEDVAASLANISLISWSEGDANSNTVLNTKDGYAEVTFNKDTKMMTKAEYVLITVADVQHANVAMFKDKSAQATFKYVESFPG